jgi:GNAT superfamily N-acetyltransferase
METVLHFRKELITPPVALAVAGVQLRTFMLPGDVSHWLKLRDRAMADQVPSVRSWTDADFHAEMISKPWWTSERTWLATAGELRLAGPATRRSPAIQRDVPNTIIGAVTLAVREGKTARAAVVHWLLVDPVWRRRGVGRILLSHAERAAWDAGWREVQLETHAGWSAAVAFYHSMGYAPVRERSPR